MRVSLSVLACAWLSGGDDETKSVRVSSPPDARGLGTDRSLQTATGAKRIGCRQRLPSASWLASLYPAMLVIKVVCRWPLPPLSQRHLHLDNCASRMVARPKRKRMKKSSKIDSINIRRHHLGVTGIVYSEGYAYAVRYAPNTRVTEELIRKSWRESRTSFRPYNDSTDMFL